MEKWKVTLSNGEVIDEHDMQSWRKLRAKCESEKLTIRSLKSKGAEVDERATSYFVIFDSLSFVKSGQNRFRRGIGSFRPNGKARIVWETASGTIKGGDYTEIVKKINAKWHDVTIEVDRSQNNEEINK